MKIKYVGASKPQVVKSVNELDRLLKACEGAVQDFTFAYKNWNIKATRRAPEFLIPVHSFLPTSAKPKMR
jgi:hypothetical protein